MPSGNLPTRRSADRRECQILWPDPFWAKASYLRQKEKGQRHRTILRGLACQWIRIILRCWQTGQSCNEVRYLEVLTKRQSPLIAIIQKLTELPEPQPISS